jgi:hypothetical protein
MNETGFSFLMPVLTSQSCASILRIITRFNRIAGTQPPCQRRIVQRYDTESRFLRGAFFDPLHSFLQAFDIVVPRPSESFSEKHAKKYY